MTFESLGLKKPILAGVRAAGYEKPTEIQECAIPLVLKGHDLIGLGQTGSGKTAAFGLPLLNALVGGEPGLRALILVPTRELCVQVAENLRAYAKETGLHVCTAFGGVDLSIQESAFKRGLDLLVACPGRLIDHLERRNVTLERVQAVVLDEADRMLDMGFIPQIRKIFTRLPMQRQNLLFSATMPPEIEFLVHDFMPDAQRVQIGRRSQAANTLSHRFVSVKQTEKTRVLEKLLEQENGKVLIFVKKKVGAERLGNQLKRDGLPADSIHGDKGAEARHVVLQAFTRGKVRFLVATDVAARGIDVDDIDLVLQYDMPHSVEDYVHRAGRTGRVGKKGRVMSLVSKAEMGIHKRIVSHLKEHEPRADKPDKRPDGDAGGNGAAKAGGESEPRRNRRRRRSRNGNGGSRRRSGAKAAVS